MPIDALAASASLRGPDRWIAFGTSVAGYQRLPANLSREHRPIAQPRVGDVLSENFKNQISNFKVMDRL